MAMDWPYDDDPETATEPAPQWACPDDTCQCHPIKSSEEEYEFSVMLLSPTGERMSGAICRMQYQGRVINEPQPNADDSGWVTAKVPRVPATVLVEWAPASAPRTPGYPYRTRYYVDLDVDLGGEREANRRRLHNLGYSHQLSLAENVKAFQRAYGYEDVTGDLKDIKDDLVLYHDDGCAPRLEGEPGGAPAPSPTQGPVADVPSLQKGRGDRITRTPGASKAKLGPDDKDAAPPASGAEGDQKSVKLPPQEPTGTPKSQGGQPLGNGAAQNPRKLPSILKALDDVKSIAGGSKSQAADPRLTPGLFEFVLLSSEWTDPTDEKRTMWGFFWIFADALMWEVPNDAVWGGWKGTGVEQPLPRKPYGGMTISDRKRLVRLPCTGKEAQEAADRLAFSQAELLGFDGGADLQTITSADKVPCILPTAELYDLSYLQADVRIGVNSVPMSNLEDNTLKYTELVAKAFDDARKKNTALTEPPKSLGTPGKIWAIADRMDTWVWCERFCNWAFACINHGFHTGITWDARGNPRVQKPVQRQGGCHDWGHTDYSQIFSTVAGWCIVKGPDETDATWRRTEAVYSDRSSKQLWRLVRDAGPVPATRYHGQRSTDPPRPTAPPANASKKCVEEWEKRKKK